MATVPGLNSIRDKFTSTGPARAVVAITKNNNADLPDGTCQAFVCGAAGTLSFIDAYGNTVTNYPAQAGYNPVMLKRVLEGGTADNLWALY